MLKDKQAVFRWVTQQLKLYKQKNAWNGVALFHVYQSQANSNTSARSVARFSESEAKMWLPTEAASLVSMPQRSTLQKYARVMGRVLDRFIVDTALEVSTGSLCLSVDTSTKNGVETLAMNFSFIQTIPESEFRDLNLELQSLKENSTRKSEIECIQFWNGKPSNISPLPRQIENHTAATMSQVIITTLRERFGKSQHRISPILIGDGAAVNYRLMEDLCGEIGTLSFIRCIGHLLHNSFNVAYFSIFESADTTDHQLEEEDTTDNDISQASFTKQVMFVCRSWNHSNKTLITWAWMKLFPNTPRFGLPTPTITRWGNFLHLCEQIMIHRSTLFQIADEISKLGVSTRNFGAAASILVSPIIIAWIQCLGIFFNFESFGWEAAMTLARRITHRPDQIPIFVTHLRNSKDVFMTFFDELFLDSMDIVPETSKKEFREEIFSFVQLIFEKCLKDLEIWSSDPFLKTVYLWDPEMGAQIAGELLSFIEETADFVETQTVSESEVPVLPESLFRCGDVDPLTQFIQQNWNDLESISQHQLQFEKCPKLVQSWKKLWSGVRTNTEACESVFRYFNEANHPSQLFSRTALLTGMKTNSTFLETHLNIATDLRTFQINELFNQEKVIERKLEQESSQKISEATTRKLDTICVRHEKKSYRKKDPRLTQLDEFHSRIQKNSKKSWNKPTATVSTCKLILKQAKLTVI